MLNEPTFGSCNQTFYSQCTQTEISIFRKRLWLLRVSINRGAVKGTKSRKCNYMWVYSSYKELCLQGLYGADTCELSIYKYILKEEPDIKL